MVQPDIRVAGEIEFSLDLSCKEVPGCGNVITFFQFLFIALEGFIFTSKFGRVKPTVPIRNYVVLVSMFFATSVANNYALNFNISMPLHMIFKSGSLVTNMILGMIMLKRRYAPVKYISVLIVSCGIFLTTWASQSLKDGEADRETSSSVVGILLLLFALLVSSGLGVYQEVLFQMYGKQSHEALFYSHALPLPGFLFLAGDIYSKVPLFHLSEPVNIFGLCSIPWLWLCLLGNVMMQYICIRTVFIIAATYSSLTVTMILTFRKFLSLVLSILYFRNPFTLFHWLGASLVFVGTLLFADFRGFKTKAQ